jgi:iron complex outermembrane receptor protein
VNRVSRRSLAIKPCLLALAVAAALPTAAERLDIAQAAAQQQAQQSTRRIYAQELVDTLVTRHPELLQVDIHEIQPGTNEGVIVAAHTRARIGKKSDPDDIEVFKTGNARVEINRAGDQNVEVSLPLIDVARRTIGTLELTLPYPPGMDEQALVAQGEKYRDELSRRILSDTRLTDPVRLDASIPLRIQAQSLVDEALATNPAVEVIAIHAPPPGGGPGYPIIASNIGRIGKTGDPSDMEVVRDGRLVAAADARGARYEVKLPLQDARGATIGVLAVVFALKPGSDQASLRARAEKIRDEMRPRIVAANDLYGPYVAVAAAPRDPVQTDYDKAELGNKQSLPMTKAVTSGAELEQASQEGYSEAIQKVAGVTPANSKGSANDSVTVRGIKLNLFSNYRINGGLPIAGVITVPNENKERIETLKGANALMFGVASPAGIINLVTKRAGDIPVTSLAVAGNSFGQFGGSLDVGRRLGENGGLGVRVNISGVHLENGIRNTGGNGKFFGVGADLRATDRLTIQADYEWYNKHVLEQAGISLLGAVKDNGTACGAADPRTCHVPITNVPNPRNFLGGPWEIYNPYTQNRVVRADYVLTDNWKVFAETGRSDAGRSRYTVRIGGYDIVTGANGLATVNFTQQEYKNAFGRAEALGRFNTWMLTHDVTLGMSKAIRDAINLFASNGTVSQRQNIYDPIELPFPTLTTGKPAAFNSSTDIGYYGYDTIGVTQKLKLLLGLRHVKDIEQSGTTVNISHVNSPAYGALYDVLPSLTLFASYMEGLEAGGTAPATAVNFNEILPPAISKQKEIGIRDSHIRGLSLSGSYFQITRANAVTDPVTRVFANSGDIDYKGVEFTGSWNFLPRWTLSGAAQWLKAKQVSPDPQFNGFWPENTPEKSGNVQVAWRPVGLPGLTLSGGVSGIARRFVNNQEQGTIPGYALYFAGVGYTTRVRGKRVAMQLNADNLANLRYWNGVQTGTYGIGMDRSLKFNIRVDL